MITISKFLLKTYEANINSISLSESIKEARRQFIKSIRKSGSDVGDYIIIASDDIVMPREIPDFILRSLPLSLGEGILVKKIQPYQDDLKVCTLVQEQTSSW